MDLLNNLKNSEDRESLFSLIRDNQSSNLLRDCLIEERNKCISLAEKAANNCDYDKASVHLVQSKTIKGFIDFIKEIQKYQG